jgi:hypothetical protein
LEARKYIKVHKTVKVYMYFVHNLEVDSLTDLFVKIVCIKYIDRKFSQLKDIQGVFEVEAFLVA